MKRTDSGLAVSVFPRRRTTISTPGFLQSEEKEELDNDDEHSKTLRRIRKRRRRGRRRRKDEVNSI